MRSATALLSCSLAAMLAVAVPSTAAAQSPWAIDIGIGLQPTLNGNINSGAIGTLQGQAAAILPNTFADVYGTGFDFRFGAGFQLDDVNELRGMFIYQSSDADLVRLGDLGPSSLYGQYADYKSFALDFGYRRYIPLNVRDMRVYAEGTAGIGFIDSINVLLAAPQANLVVDNTDFYDQTATFTLGVNAGVLFRVAEHVDLNAQIGLRRMSGLAEVDQLAGTGLAEINDDTGRLTVPVVVGIRLRLP
jgi:hypothetical protein